MSAMWINVQTAQPVRSIKKREKRGILMKNFFNEFKKFISRFCLIWYKVLYTAAEKKERTGG